MVWRMVVAARRNSVAEEMQSPRSLNISLMIAVFPFRGEEEIGIVLVILSPLTT